MIIIEDLKKLADEQKKLKLTAKEKCKQEKLVWTFNVCKEKGCRHTYRQRYWCNTIGCIHDTRSWGGPAIPYEDLFDPKNNTES